ncbi:hypothetical protein KSF_075790 [Reticulibacter mediterranei]|uniref:HTH cro/C1-type domain-containing protein n=1 Tax=Reticulibacter mediterranei TaxID=2778369 RepID=A0A8J3IWV6_9CHLR|nr:AAA family ATPase [Reticulibacter mediterranei]GHO97531.1 hypothetical protein KSF_075790 [Reticulibacter mediterranei]
MPPSDRSHTTNRLRQERIARNWRQRDLAEQLGTTIVSVTRWERGIQQPSAYFRVKLCALFGKSAEELGLLARNPSSQRTVSQPPPLVSMPPLPVQIRFFLGRSRELAEVQRLLHASRLLTLTGIGGVGKTRLALRVAEEMAPTFADGACFVDLAPLSDPRLVANAIASALGVMEHPTEALSETLKRALARREVLLLLDNFEHVLKEAPLVSELLSTTSRLKVLVTSREPLRLVGEQEYLVPPLSLPEVETPSAQNLIQSEAGLFFVRCAQLVSPHFEVSEVTAPVIGRICTRLDGIPLALELAAARCKLFTPHALLERLEGTREVSPLRLLTARSRNVPSRQQTLYSSVAWSYTLLNEQEQRLLARLTVFRGGSTLKAIESICSEGLSLDVIDALSSLVDKHLVQQKEMPNGEPRFFMLEMIQEYARERLQTSGEEEPMRRRHASYFVELAERAESELRLAGFERWSGRLTQDLENLRTVLSWSLSGGNVELGIRLAGALCLFWYGNGHHMEGRRWTQQLFTRLNEVPLVYHPKLLLSAGHFAFLYDLDAAASLFRRVLEVASALGDRLQVAWALLFLGYTLFRDRTVAMPLVEESLTLFRELANPPGIAQALNIVGEIARYNNDDDQARQAYEACLALCQQTGEIRRIGLMYKNLTFLALHEGDAERARDLGRQGLQVARTMNHQLDQAKALVILAGALGALGQPKLATKLFGTSERALERLGAVTVPIPSDASEIAGMIATIRAHLDEATFQAAWTEGREMTLEQAMTQALDA